MKVIQSTVLLLKAKKECNHNMKRLYINIVLSIDATRIFLQIKWFHVLPGCHDEIQV